MVVWFREGGVEVVGRESLGEGVRVVEGIVVADVEVDGAPMPDELVTGAPEDDELFSDERRRVMVNELFAMATGRGPTKISDAARVRASEQYNKIGAEHWERRSAADDDAVVGELLARMTLVEIDAALEAVRLILVPEVDDG